MEEDAKALWVVGLLVYAADKREQMKASLRLSGLLLPWGAPIARRPIIIGRFSVTGDLLVVSKKAD